MNNEQYDKTLLALKNRTLSSVYKNSRYRSPVLISNRNVNYKETVNIYPVEHFHYGDRTYSSISSIDNPESSVGVLKIDNLPISTLIRKNEKKSFVCNMHDILYQRYCEPFMIFINGKFVNLNYISILFDYGEFYILLYGDEYNYYKLKFANIDIVILPFRIDYIGEESNDFFDFMYDVYKSYIQKSLVYNNDKYSITVPGIDTVYEYKSMVYNIGAWLYSQLKYNYLGLLSDYKINKLRNINIVRNTYDGAGNIINTYNMKFNALDKDSYNRTIYNNICNMDLQQYITSAMFRFNTNGKLDDNGNNILAISNTDIEWYKISLNSSIYKNETTHNLFRHNYLIFKNGIFNPECEINTYYNIATIKDYENSILYVISNKNILDLKCHSNIHFPNIAYDYLKNITDLEYVQNIFDPFDFDTDSSKNYNDNVSALIDSAIYYDASLLNDFYNTNIESKIFSGKEINDNMTEFNNVRGYIINRNKYDYHESYIIIFLNGELIEEYNNLIVFPNHFFIPTNKVYNDTDKIEVLFFNKVNNNEIFFKMNSNILNEPLNDPSKYQDIETTIFSKYIEPSELKIFTRYPEDMLIYKSLIPESEKIAFNVSKYEDEKIFINSSISYGTELIAVSSRKFIYQRLIPEQKTYKIQLDPRFKYCDNQKQYILFINGRRMADDSFLITIPKYSRPFWGMYLYTTKFVSPEDRVDLFYLPEELIDINYDNSSHLDESGFIQSDKRFVDVPYNPDLYLLFINGKKIPKDDIIAVDSSTFRIKSDQYSTNNLMINPIYTESYDKIKEYMRSGKYNSYDKIMKSLSLSEINNIYGITSTISNINDESYKVNTNVARIAILNEIIRDFWVSSIYEYNEIPFAYDYIDDEYINNMTISLPDSTILLPIDTEDESNIDITEESDLADLPDDEIILPIDCITESGGELNDIDILNINFTILTSLDSTRFENIIKDKLLFVSTEDDSSYNYEMGDFINSMNISWEYSFGFYNALKLYRQYIEYKTINDEDYTTIDIDDLESRSYTFESVYLDTEIIIHGISARSSAKKIINVNFYNGIYYGLIDENDSKDINSDEEVISIMNKFNDNQFTKLLQDSAEIDLKNYIIGNNNYFVYACPKRLAFDENGNQIIDFIMPEVCNQDIIQNCRDDKTTPIYTSGEYNIYETHNLFKKLPKMEMIYLGEFNYINSKNYGETYCIWRSNGYFTRLFNNYGFNIKIKYKN